MEWSTIQTLADIGLGGIALVLYRRQGEILKNVVAIQATHGIRIAKLERRKRVK